MSRPTAFYRTNVTRYAFVLTGAFLAYALSPWAPQAWHDTPSLRWLHELVPYTVMAAGFGIYTVLLLIDRLETYIAAAAIGLAAYSIGLIALLGTLRFDRPTNPLSLAAVVGACVLHFAAARLAIFEKESD